MARRTTLVLGVLAGAIATALIGGIAWAAIPGAGGIVQGCYDGGGNVKVVNALPCPKGYTPFAFLGTTAKAADSDKLDGIDSTGFLGATAKAADSDKLDGMDSTDFLGGAWAAVNADGTIARSRGVNSVANLGDLFQVDFVHDARFACAILANLGNSFDTQAQQGQVVVNPNTLGNVNVRTADSAGTQVQRAFFIALLC